MMAVMGLPDGVTLRPLELHGDERGGLAEIFRAAWVDPIAVQWNLLRTSAGVMRGVRVHPVHTDHMVTLQGRSAVGLRDLRRRSPTEGMATLLEMDGDAMALLTIPPGVAHGFYFPAPALQIIGVSHYWDPADELGCRWDDPELAIPWPHIAPAVSLRDIALPSLRALRAHLAM
jgi:dTDP-4-dehydrorhamnose 3,5-epimerase